MVIIKGCTFRLKSIGTALRFLVSTVYISYSFFSASSCLLPGTPFRLNTTTLAIITMPPIIVPISGTSLSRTNPSTEATRGITNSQLLTVLVFSARIYRRGLPGKALYKALPERQELLPHRNPTQLPEQMQAFQQRRILRSMSLYP